MTRPSTRPSKIYAIALPFPTFLSCGASKLFRSKTIQLISTHNLPPTEANTRERGVGWGHMRAEPRRPRQEASPPAPLLYRGISDTCIYKGDLEMHYATSPLCLACG